MCPLEPPLSMSASQIFWSFGSLVLWSPGLPAPQSFGYQVFHLFSSLVLVLWSPGLTARSRFCYQVFSLLSPLVPVLQLLYCFGPLVYRPVVLWLSGISSSQSLGPSSYGTLVIRASERDGVWVASGSVGSVRQCGEAYRRVRVMRSRTKLHLVKINLLNMRTYEQVAQARPWRRRPVRGNDGERSCSLVDLEPGASALVATVHELRNLLLRSSVEITNTYFKNH